MKLLVLSFVAFVHGVVLADVGRLEALDNGFLFFISFCPSRNKTLLFILNWQVGMNGSFNSFKSSLLIMVFSLMHLHSSYNRLGYLQIFCLVLSCVQYFNSCSFPLPFSTLFDFFLSDSSSLYRHCSFWCFFVYLLHVHKIAEP